MSPRSGTSVRSATRPWTRIPKVSLVSPSRKSSVPGSAVKRRPSSARRVWAFSLRPDANHDVFRAAISAAVSFMGASVRSGAGPRESRGARRRGPLVPPERAAARARHLPSRASAAALRAPPLRPARALPRPGGVREDQVGRDLAREEDERDAAARLRPAADEVRVGEVRGAVRRAEEGALPVAGGEGEDRAEVRVVGGRELRRAPVGPRLDRLGAQADEPAEALQDPPPGRRRGSFPTTPDRGGAGSGSARRERTAGSRPERGPGGPSRRSPQGGRRRRSGRAGGRGRR